MDLYEALDNMVIQTKFSKDGCFNTQSSKEYFVQLIMENVPINEKDVIVDVGCGVGKMLAMLHSHCMAKIIGVEIDPVIAEIARERTKCMDNIKVITSNILDCEAEIAEASIFYLFNPFNENILDSFLTKVETIGRKDVRVIYSNDVYMEVFNRHHWLQIHYEAFDHLRKTGGISVWAQGI